MSSQLLLHNINENRYTFVFLLNTRCSLFCEVNVIRTVRMNVSCNSRNPPQISQTTPKPAKYQTNHPLISQKLHCFFPEDIFYKPHFLCPSRARREIGALFDIPARFRILSSPLHSFLPSLIADYNPSHKLWTQLGILTNFLRILGLTILHWKSCYKHLKGTSIFKGVR